MFSADPVKRRQNENKPKMRAFGVWNLTYVKYFTDEIIIHDVLTETKIRYDYL